MNDEAPYTGWGAARSQPAKLEKSGGSKMERQREEERERGLKSFELPFLTVSMQSAGYGALTAREILGYKPG